MNERIRIALFSHTSGLDGAGRSFADLVEGLVRHGCECLAVFPESGDLLDQLRSRGVCVYDYGNRNAWHWSYQTNGAELEAQKYAEELSDILCDLVPVVQRFEPSYIVTSTITSPVGLAIAELLNLPSAVSVREYGDEDHDLTLVYGLKSSMQAVYESCSSIFCVTEDVRSYHFGVDPLGKCKVIYSNIRITHNRPISAQTTDPSNLKSKFHKPGFVVLLPATLQTGKGQIELVEATQILLKRGYKINCAFTGASSDATYLNALKERIDQTGTPDRYVILEFDADIYSLMKDADCIVSCSRREALSRTLIESSLLGVPIVYADSGGASEVFEDIEHGLRYQWGSAENLAQCIERNLLNPKEALERAERAKQRCLAKFTTDTYAGAVLRRIRADLSRPLRQHNSLLKLTSKLADVSLIQSWGVKITQVDTTGARLQEEVRKLSLGQFELTIDTLPNVTKLQLSSFSFIPVSLEQLFITYDHEVYTASGCAAKTLYPGFGAKTSVTMPITASIDLLPSKKRYLIRVYGKVHRRRRAALLQILASKERELFDLRNATASALFVSGDGFGAQLIKQSTMGRTLLIWGTGAVSKSVSAYLQKWQICDFLTIDATLQDGASEIDDRITLKGLQQLIHSPNPPFIIFATSQFSDHHHSWLPEGFKEIKDFVVIGDILGEKSAAQNIADSTDRGELP